MEVVKTIVLNKNNDEKENGERNGRIERLEMVLQTISAIYKLLRR